MFEERFIQLVEENGGFEFYQAYRNDVLTPIISRAHVSQGSIYGLHLGTYARRRLVSPTSKNVPH